jgi:hypothetical protein
MTLFSAMVSEALMYVFPLGLLEFNYNPITLFVLIPNLELRGWGTITENLMQKTKHLGTPFPKW